MIVRRLILFMLLVLLLLGGLLYLAGTEKGTRILWDVVTRKFPDQITASRLQGGLADRVIIDDLHIEMADFIIDAGQFEFGWQVDLLFTPELLIDLIRMEDLAIYDRRDPAQQSKESVTLTDINLPFPISVKRFELNQASYTSTSLEKPLQIDQLVFSLQANEQRIRVGELQVQMHGIQAALTGELQPRKHYPLDFALLWKAALPDQPEFTGSGKVHGDLHDLQIEQKITSPARADLTVRLRQPLTELNWSADLDLGELRLQDLKNDLPEIEVGTHLTASGDLHDLQVRGDYHLVSDEFGGWRGAVDIQHNLPTYLHINSLTIRSADTAANAEIHGAVDLAAEPLLDLQINWQQFQWPLIGTAAITSTAGAAALNGKADAWQVQIDGAMNHPQTGDITLALSGHGDTQHFVIQQFSGDLLSGQLNSSGAVNWAGKPLKFDIKGDWHDIHWQDAQQSILSPQGNFQLNGHTDHYTLTLDTAVEGTKIPAGKWQITGSGSSSAFDVQSLHANILDGAVDLSGKIGWGEALTWDIQLDGKQINPGLIQQDWPGKLDLSIKSSGEKSADQLLAQIRKSTIKGRLRGYPFNAVTDLDVQDKQVTIRQLDLNSGQSGLKTSGQAGEKLDLKFTLESPNLAELYPDAGGQLTARGSIKGLAQKPSIDANARGANVSFPGVKLGKLDTTVKLDLAKGEQFSITLRSSQVQAGGTLIDSLDLTSSGTLAAHSINADVDAQQGKLRLAARGGLEKERWQGTLQDLILEEQKFGLWKLDRPVKLMASNQQIDLDRLCLSMKQSHLCLGGQWQAAGPWRAESDIVQLPLTMFGPFLPPDMTLEGEISSSLSASGTGNKAIRAKLDLNASPGSIALDKTDDQPRFDYDKATLALVINEQGSRANLFIDLTQPTASPIRAILQTPAFDPANVDFTNLPLSGSLTTRIDDLGFMPALTDELEEVKGSLDVDLKVAGTVGKPKLAGHAKLNADLIVPSAGIHLQDVRLDATSHNSKTLAFTGQARSGPGRVDLKGSLGLAEDGFPLSAEIKGDRFELANLPEAWVLASPDLQISSQKERLNIEGSVHIPEAKLEPQGIASAVPISDDVIILNDPEEAEKKKRALKITSKVKLTLGDKISLKASGFSGALKGGLLVKSRPGKAPTGAGELIIEDGLFSAYNQELEINKGRIIFAGGPLDSPSLDLKAIRQIDEITAGVHVTGPATSPELTLFSKPGMNQDNILSYLLIGRPLNEASASDSDILLGAASSLGFKGGEMLTQNIGQTLGLDEFSIGGNGSDAASLQLGKYLTPKLYISYGVGLFESVTQLKLRYDFSRRWSLEAESGTHSGMDFLYKYEK